MRTDKGWNELQREKARNELTWGKIISEITKTMLTVVGAFAFVIAVLLF